MFAILLLGGCHWPTHNPAKLESIKVEALALMTSHPLKPSGLSADVPKSQWPPTISSLKPEFVTVHTWGVDISTTPYFDGGWRYQVSKRKKSDLPMPEACYQELHQGVFWHGPC